MDSFFLSSSFFRNCMRIVSFGRIIAAVLLSSIPGQFNCPLSPVAIPLFRYTAIPSPVKLEVAICDIQHLFHFGTSARVCKEFLLTTISNSDLFLRSQIATIKSFFPFPRLPIGSHRPLSRMPSGVLCPLARHWMPVSSVCREADQAHRECPVNIRRSKCAARVSEKHRTP